MIQIRNFSGKQVYSFPETMYFMNNVFCHRDCARFTQIWKNYVSMCPENNPYPNACPKPKYFLKFGT